MDILVVYGSTHGHTARIAARIAARLRDGGAKVVVTGEPRGVRAGDFDAVVVGGRVHGSRYPWRVTRFVRRNIGALRSRPSAFFSVSLLQLANRSAERLRTERLPEIALSKLGWKPDRVEVVGGALLWKPQYGVLAPLFKRMWRSQLGTRLDTSLDEQVFTDWAQVDRFAEDFLSFAESRIARDDDARASDAARLPSGGRSTGRAEVTAPE